MLKTWIRDSKIDVKHYVFELVDASFNEQVVTCVHFFTDSDDTEFLFLQWKTCTKEIYWKGYVLFLRA